MQVFKHLTANNIQLESMPFQKELSMEAYLIENEGVLALDNEILSSVEIIETELTLKQGRKSKKTDRRIDILVTYSEELIGIIELKLGELTQVHVDQLKDYLEQREQIIEDYSDLLNPELVERPKWIGVLVGSSIDRELEKKITNGDLSLHNIPVAALTIKRYRGSDGLIYVVTDTYFSKLSTKDYTKYKFNGKLFGKGRLVLTVVRKFAEDNPNITYSELMKVFPEKTQGTMGVFALKSKAEEIFASTSKKRHFINPDDIIQLKDAAIAVCTQWGVSNIDNFITVAKQDGYDIEPMSG